MLATHTQAAAPAGRYQLTVDTARDTVTLLEWQRSWCLVGAGVFPPTWSEASTCCANLALSGSGWRLPTVKEFMTILDFRTTSFSFFDPAAFPYDAPEWGSTYWTSSTLAGYPGYHVAVRGYDGTAGLWRDDNSISVRCVR
jgi:hypothetical protein